MVHLTSKPGMTDTVQATVILPANRFVKVDGTVCGAGEKAWGSTELSFDIKEQAGVIISGVVLLEAGGAIPLGAEITSDATGRAVVAAGSDKINGWAGSVAAIAGEFVSVRLN